jgi:hypothetical protein
MACSDLDWAYALDRAITLCDWTLARYAWRELCERTPSLVDDYPMLDTLLARKEHLLKLAAMQTKCRH